MVISAAGDRAQAKLCFKEAARMVRANPFLRKHAQVYRDHIINNRNGGIYRAVSADAGLQQGLNPSFVVFDEVHVFKNDDLIEALTLGSAMRQNPLFLFISTAGYDLDTPLGRLYQTGRKVESGEVNDPTFGFTWFGPKDGEKVDPGDPRNWRRFNPAYDIMPDPETYFRASLKQRGDNGFTRYCLNGWTATRESWFKFGQWDALAQLGHQLVPGDEVVLGFDGARQHDCTCLVACRLRDKKLFVLNLWEAPEDDQEWRTPSSEVKQAFRDACDLYDVKEIACDPWLWQADLQDLEDEGLPVIEFPQTRGRMSPAIQLFQEAVFDKRLSHDGDPRLSRHIRNTVLKEDNNGLAIYKVSKNSKRKIDLAVASVMAHARACAWQEPEPAREAQLLILGD